MTQESLHAQLKYIWEREQDAYRRNHMAKVAQQIMALLELKLKSLSSFTHASAKALSVYGHQVA